MYNSSPYSVSKGVRLLLIITGAIYVFELIPRVGDWILSIGALQPEATVLSGQIWRLFTYLFLHDSMSPWHILFNMLGLWMFGVELENMWGYKRFLLFYCIVGIGSGILSLAMIFVAPSMIIGASGAILGILTAYAYYFPQRQILMFFFLPMTTRTAVIIYGVIAMIGAIGTVGGIAHITHLGGIIVALLYLRYYNQIESMIIHWRAQKAERIMRSNAEKKIAGDRYFEEVIDPILKKISEKGMDSLTKDELNNLKRYSKRH